tara:strand:+ start:192 stop:896 length:705 start_codon:yes stop_codon:yes gene_type:complete
MDCKLSPSAKPWRITLKPDGILDIEADIVGLSSLRKAGLEDYLEVVCLVSPLAIDSNAVTSITGWLNDGKNWWSEYDKWWYELASVESFVTHTIKRIKNQAEHIEFYDIDMSEHFPVVSFNGYESPEDPDRDWNKIKDITYMIYVQVDTQQMATDYKITIPDEYKGMMGAPMIGHIYADGEESEDIAIIDNRFSDAEPSNSLDSGGTGVCAPDSNSNTPDAQDTTPITQGTPGP